MDRSTPDFVCHFGQGSPDLAIITKQDNCQPTCLSYPRHKINGSGGNSRIWIVFPVMEGGKRNISMRGAGGAPRVLYKYFTSTLLYGSGVLTSPTFTITGTVSHHKLSLDFDNLEKVGCRQILDPTLV